MQRRQPRSCLIHFSYQDVNDLFSLGIRNSQSMPSYVCTSRTRSAVTGRVHSRPRPSPLEKPAPSSPACSLWRRRGDGMSLEHLHNYPSLGVSFVQNCTMLSTKRGHGKGRIFVCDGDCNHCRSGFCRLELKSHENRIRFGSRRMSARSAFCSGNFRPACAQHTCTWYVRPVSIGDNMATIGFIRS